MPEQGKVWERISSVATISSPWVTMHCERWRDGSGADLDYWRVEHVHSVVVLTLHAGQVLLPAPMFRPGVGRATLDLPGGRMPDGMTPEETAVSVIRRELAVAPEAIRDLTPLNPGGWMVNSSFNNQLLFCLVATIDEGAVVPGEGFISYPADRAGLRRLASDLDCLQCRAAVQEFLLGMEEA